MQNNTLQRQEGSALVLALIAALLLFIVSFEVAHTTRIESFIAENIEVDTKLDVACRAGLEKALATLREDRQTTEVDSTGESWWGIKIHTELKEDEAASEEFLAEEDFSGNSDLDTDTKLIIETFDESAKFNIYLLLADDEKDLRKRQEYFANVVDYYRQDTDGDLGFQQGLELAKEISIFLRRDEENPYGDGILKPETKEAATLTTLDELLYVKGITPSIFYDSYSADGEQFMPGLFRFITIWSDLQININTGELPALAGLFESKNAQIAEEILEYRTESAEEQDLEAKDRENVGQEEEVDASGGAAFTQISDLREKVEGVTQEIYNELSDFITVQSQVFSIYVTAERGYVRRTKMWVVRRGPQGFRSLMERPVEFPYYIAPERLEQAGEEELQNY